MRAATITKSISLPVVDNKAIPTVQSNPLVVEEIKELLTTQQSPEYYKMIAMLVAQYQLVIDAIDSKNWRSVKLGLEAARDLTALLGLNAPTKTISASASTTEEYDLSGYKPLGT